MQKWPLSSFLPFLSSLSIGLQHSLRSRSVIFSEPLYLSDITNRSIKHLMKQRRRNICPVIKKNEKRRHRGCHVPCNCPLLYEVHFKLLFSFSPTSWLITSCMYWKWGAVNVELLLRSLLLLSKITPVVNAFRRPPTNYIIWLFVGICCILVSVEGQMKGSLVTKGHVALHMKLIIFRRVYSECNSIR